MSNSWYEHRENVKILYEGSKTFWKYNNIVIDIIFALHINYNTIEIISYSKRYNSSAPRIYVSLSTLKSLIDPYELNNRIDKVREDNKNNYKFTSIKNVTTNVLNELCLEYIIQRLIIKDNNNKNTSNYNDANKLEMELTIKLNDRTYNLNNKQVNSCVIECPQLLIPLLVHYNKIITKTEMAKAVQVLNFEKLGLKRATRELESQASKYEMLSSNDIISNYRVRSNWKWFLHKVLLMITVEKVKERLRRSKIAYWFSTTAVEQRYQQQLLIFNTTNKQYAHDTTNNNINKLRNISKAISIAVKLSNNHQHNKGCRDDSYLPHITKEKLHSINSKHDKDLKIWSKILKKKTNNSNNNSVIRHNWKSLHGDIGSEAHLKHTSHGTIYVNIKNNSNSTLPPIGAPYQTHHYDHLINNDNSRSKHDGYFIDRSRIWQRQRPKISDIVSHIYNKNHITNSDDSNSDNNNNNNNNNNISYHLEKNNSHNSFSTSSKSNATSPDRVPSLVESFQDISSHSSSRTLSRQHLEAEMKLGPHLHRSEQLPSPNHRHIQPPSPHFRLSEVHSHHRYEQLPSPQLKLPLKQSRNKFDEFNESK